MAYRARKQAKTAQAATTGVVADMVRQFADRYAFLRELVQNAIDAGSRQIVVTLSHDGRQQAAISVRDNGSGMSRAIVEGPLLTLFSSAKESDKSKIGKYGVGFVSVFAIEPDEVIVETWTAAESLRLRLWADHRYQLERGESHAGSGTVVTLVLTADSSAFAEHVTRGQAALSRWCRHAAIPIELHVHDASARAPVRIDTPLAVDGVAQVSQSYADGTRIVAALSDGEAGAVELSDSFQGFYCRGLTLHESNHAMTADFGYVRFKVDCPALQHTLSRDNVRHGAAYQQALVRVRALVRGPLRARLLEVLAESAQQPDGLSTYARQLNAALMAPLDLDADELPAPLVDPHPEHGPCCAADELKRGDMLLYAVASDALTQAVASEGMAVLRADAGSARRLASFLQCSAVTPAEIFVLASPLAPAAVSAIDRSLCAQLLSALRVVGARVRDVELAQLLPARIPRAAVAADTPHSTQLLRQEATHNWWARWGDGPVLRLVVGHAAVARARTLAAHDVFAAAHLLARYLLVEERGQLSARHNDLLLHHALEHSALQHSDSGQAPAVGGER